MEAGWQVTVITRWQESYGLNTEIMVKLEAMGVRCARIDRSDGPINLRACYLVIRDLFFERPDVLLAIGVGWAAVGLALFRTAQRNLYFYVNHDLVSPSFQRLRWFSLFMQGIAAINPESLRPLQNIVAGGTDLAWLPQFSEPIVPEDWSPCAKGKRRRGIGFIGTLSEVKGIRELMKVWMSIDVEADLYIAGHGPCRCDVEKTAHDTAYRVRGRVVYLGSFNASDRDAFLTNFFSRVELLVVPSMAPGEGVQTVILEALAFGCPVLASRMGGALCFESEELGSPAVELYAVSELASRLLSWWRHPETAVDHQAIRKRYDEHFGDATLRGKWLSFLAGTKTCAAVQVV